MANRVSTQSGNFTSTSTWGGSAYPVDGDTFTVEVGHIVTVNSDVTSTNGYGDSYVEGKLYITGSGKLKMNGVLLVRDGNSSTNTLGYFSEGNPSGPYFRMDAGAILEIKGNKSAQHALRGETHKYVWIECEGTDPRTKTTLAATETIGSTSLALTSSSGFASGDWISLYVELENVVDWEKQKALREEAFILHDISGNTVYFRQFVSPSSDVTVASGNLVYVEDASVFRVGYNIIVGEGSNRNIKTITAIDKAANKITVNSNITGSIVGLTVYQTGTEKWHSSGDSVQKIATPLTADSSSGANTITVANTNGLVVGKRILIEANNPGDTNWDYEMRYEIQSISGNIITLTTNLGNDRKIGAWVTPFDRDTQIKAATVQEDASADQNTEDVPYIWIEHSSSSDMYYRRIRFRNVLFEGIGSNDSNTSWYRGVMLGRASYETNSYGAYTSGLEGCVYTPNKRHSYSCMGWRESHYQCARRNIIYNTYYGFWRWSSGNDMCISNNISWRSAYTTALMDGFYESRAALIYNHFARSDDYGTLFYHARIASQEVRHNYWVFHEHRPIYFYYQTNNFVMERNYFDHYRIWPYIGAGGGQLIMLNSYLGNAWDSTTPGVTSPINGIYVSNDGSNRPDRTNGQANKIISVNHNFKEDNTAVWGAYWWKIWDDDESAWRYRRTYNTSNHGGDPEAVLVPAGATVYCAAEIKMTVSNHGGTRPYLVAASVQGFNKGSWLDGITSSNQSASSNPDGYPMGHYASAAFTSACDSAYERKTLTVSPVNYDYYLRVTVITTSNNIGQGDEGWYQKPIEIYMNKTSGAKEKTFLNTTQTNVGYGTSTTRSKTRIGGRIK